MNTFSSHQMVLSLIDDNSPQNKVEYPQKTHTSKDEISFTLPNQKIKKENPATTIILDARTVPSIYSSIIPLFICPSYNSFVQISILPSS